MTSLHVPDEGCMIPVTTFVLYLALGIAAAHGRAPQSQVPQERPVHPALSPAEVSELKAKAEQGDASAQWNLGKAYEAGNRVSQSDELAAKWYRKAADQGNADAENRLGVMYRLGQGVNRDKEEAVRWYRKAAKLGNSQAMFNMGVS